MRIQARASPQSTASATRLDKRCRVAYPPAVDMAYLSQLRVTAPSAVLVSLLLLVLLIDPGGHVI